MPRTVAQLQIATCILAASLLASPLQSTAWAQHPHGQTEEADEEPSGPQPFGANLFAGNFAAQREDGINPDYRILPGDKVMVNAWGVLTINNVFSVDSQGNIFLPNIGPVHLAGVENRNLTHAVRAAIAHVYRGNFGVYTNLMTASPVAVYVTGGVSRPGRYAGIPSDSVLFFLDQAGGVDPQTGSYRHVTVMRGEDVLAELDLYDFLLRGTMPSPQFEDGDTILVGRRGPVVEVRGMVPEPKFVEMLADEGFTGEDVLEVTPRGARANEVTVRGIRDGQPMVVSLTVDRFGRAALHDGDVITFREEGRAGRILVRLEGEFVGPSVMSVRRGTRLVDLLNYVRVESGVSDVHAIHIERDSIAHQQRRAIHQSLDRLERSVMLALSDSQGEAQIRVQEAQLVQNFIERARNVQPLGQVVTASAGHQLNVLLEDGDTVVIPPRTNVVSINGEVQFAQAVMYQPQLTVRDYIRMAGGYTNRADTDAVIVVRPSAEVTIGDGDLRIHPGDEILVPPEIDNKVFQNAIDLSQIIYQIAVAASVLIRI